MSPSSADLAGLDKTKTCLGLDKRKEFDKRKTNLGLDKRKTSFLDLGTGNGEMLFLLREAGWGGRMVGVDYSGGSVEFCRRRVVGKGEGGEGGKMEFTEWDILTSSPLPSWFGNDEYEEGTGAGSGFDVVLDKGTFDAVSLCNELDEQGRRVCEGYAARVERLVRKGGLVVVTSCNWTEEELVGWFEGGGEAGLERWGRVEYPVFRFGGRQGQSVVSVVFRRKG